MTLFIIIVRQNKVLHASSSNLEAMLPEMVSQSYKMPLTSKTLSSVFQVVCIQHTHIPICI